MLIDSEDEAAVPNCGLLGTPQPSQVREKRTPVNPWSRSNVVRAEEPGQDAPTTLVLKRLPDGCTQQDVYDVLTALGLHGKFDFLYAPTNFRSRSLFGYCFVNFVEHGIAMRAMAQLRSLVWERFDDARIEAYWSEPHQGLNVHLERYRNSPVMHRAVPRMYKPILLRNGVRIAFPKPTQRVMPPKDWSRQQSKC
jgi:RNA recognition motif-containing protein